jgi:hypothetical protein
MLACTLVPVGLAGIAAAGAPLAAGRGVVICNEPSSGIS